MTAVLQFEKRDTKSAETLPAGRSQIPNFRYGADRCPAQAEIGRVGTYWIAEWGDEMKSLFAREWRE
ncbi:MAG: hypothetical protein O2856_00085 [Planctomycetota bacterium]|nr:hypothetical protein [Planctomycetota bacterium]